MSISKIHVVILAAGDGKRLKNIIPKQFLKLVGEPMLFHTFKAFSHLNDAVFHLVLNENYVNHWKEIVSEYNFTVPHSIIIGGPTRFHSVKSSLKNIPGDNIVLIHDGVRPLVSVGTINTVINIARRKGNAIPVIDINESVRQVDGIFNKAINKSNIKLVQTPQGFISNGLKKAYNAVYNENFTDDASVIEAAGVKINTVEGNIENIKITHPFDMDMAGLYLSNSN